jgi:hypothetical protein
MPTLIRLFVALVVLAGLGFAGMLALTIMVDPGEKDITIKIPARDLVASPDGDPLNVNDLPAPVNVAPKEASSSVGASVEISDPQASESGVKTVTPGAE